MTFDEIINQDKPVLVDFHAVWCGPCKVQAPILKDVKGKMGDKVSIIKVDVDKNASVAQRFQIRGVPTLILFKKGEIVWRKAGVSQASQLEGLINQNL